MADGAPRQEGQGDMSARDTGFWMGGPRDTAAKSALGLLWLQAVFRRWKRMHTMVAVAVEVVYRVALLK